jgi:hypothetical protein
LFFLTRLAGVEWSGVEWNGVTYRIFWLRVERILFDFAPSIMVWRLDVLLFFDTGVSELGGGSWNAPCMIPMCFFGVIVCERCFTYSLVCVNVEEGEIAICWGHLVCKGPDYIATQFIQQERMGWAD